MSRLTSFLRSLGAKGALANAQRALEVRAREDWLVEGLVHRMDVAAAVRAVPVTRAS